jgi:hypothetical protein
MGGTRARKAPHARFAGLTKRQSRTCSLTLCEVLRASKGRYIFQRAYWTRSAGRKQKSRLVLAARAGRSVPLLRSPSRQGLRRKFRRERYVELGLAPNCLFWVQIDSVDCC